MDAELDALGSAPDHAVALARSHAGIEVALDQLAAVDHELGLLEAPVAALAPRSASNGRSFELPAPPVREPVPEPHDFDERPSRTLESGPAPAPERAASAGSEAMESWPPLAPSEPPPAAPDDAREHDDDSPTSAVHSVPPPALTQSQEIVLPDPVARDELSTESGELRLDDENPSSGSFSLDEEPPESAPFAPASEPPAPVPARPRLSQLVNDDVGDALEGSQPISIGNSKLGPSKAPPFTFDRDPDAEFDALLSEATDPNGMPTGGDEEVEELLQGLEEEALDEDVHADLASMDFTKAAPDDTEVSEATDELALLLLDDPDEATEVHDRATLGAIEAQAPASGAVHSAAEAAVEAAAPAQEDTLTEFDAGELEMGELEIVMDEAPTKAPPPPPPAPGNNEKRPSGFLGRFFGRGERE